jgi:hypothetical protein
MCALLSSAALTASALTLTLPSDYQVTHPPGTLDAQRIADAIGGGTTAADVGSLLYKDNVGGSEDGSLQSSNETVFSFDAGEIGNDPNVATITYVGGPVADATYLAIKDGNQASHIFDISGWDGIETIIVKGVFTSTGGDGGAISHVSIWGGVGTSVPDGGATVALLGAAIGLLGFVRRKIGA